MDHLKFIFQRRSTLISDLRVRTNLRAGNCLADCNNDLGVCLSKPAGDDPFTLGVNCQAEYDQCVNDCMVV